MFIWENREGAEGENLKQMPAEHGARRGAKSYHQEIMTWAEIKNLRFNQLSHLILSTILGYSVKFSPNQPVLFLSFQLEKFLLTHIGVHWFFPQLCWDYLGICHGILYFCYSCLDFYFFLIHSHSFHFTDITHLVLYVTNFFH